VGVLGPTFAASGHRSRRLWVSTWAAFFIPSPTCITTLRIGAIYSSNLLQATLAQVSGFRGTPFLHPSLVPLDQVDFRSADEISGQLSLSGNECEGMCGV
jgi:hypothetical protein